MACHHSLFVKLVVAITLAPALRPRNDFLVERREFVGAR
jgi:hypothetical protein